MNIVARFMMLRLNSNNGFWSRKFFLDVSEKTILNLFSSKVLFYFKMRKAANLLLSFKIWCSLLVIYNTLLNFVPWGKMFCFLIESLSNLSEGRRRRIEWGSDNPKYVNLNVNSIRGQEAGDSRIKGSILSLIRRIITVNFNCTNF